MTNVLQSRILFIVLFFTVNNIKAINPFPLNYKDFLEECDACGCSNNGGSLGMGGVIDNNFIGVRYLYQEYDSRDGIFNNSPKIDENFNTIQLWSRLPISEKIDIQAFVTYHSHTRNYVDKITKIQGVGDISIFANYKVLEKRKSNYNQRKNKVTSTIHQIKIGTGIKLPTGKFDEEINNSINPSFQLGTGSVDYVTMVQYLFKSNQFGVNNYINYYIKTENKKRYKFGNQLNFNSTFFYVFKNNEKNMFVPSLGVSGEFHQKNKSFDISVRDTNGYTILSNIGIEYNTPKMTFGTMATYPLSQNLTQGNIELKYRTNFYINYNF